VSKQWAAWRDQCGKEKSRQLDLHCAGGTKRGQQPLNTNDRGTMAVALVRLKLQEMPYPNVTCWRCRSTCEDFGGGPSIIPLQTNYPANLEDCAPLCHVAISRLVHGHT